MHIYQPVNRLRVKGYSIIEFMVAIVISLIIMLAVAVAWQSGFKTQQSQSEVSRLNETIRFAMELLSREIRQAGLINTTNISIIPSETFLCSSTIGPPIIGLNDPATISPGGVATGSPLHLHLPSGTTTVANLSDAIRVRYYGEDPTAGTGTTKTTVPTYDCLGYEVKPGELVEDTLYVAVDPANKEPTLYCHTSNSNAVTAGHTTLPMVAGVESMQLLYGEVMDTNGIINQYVPWQKVNNQDHIVSVKVSIVARSARAVSLDTGPKIYYHFGDSNNHYADPTGGSPGTTFSPIDPLTDMRLRLPPMSTEIAVRNLNWCPS